LIFLFDSGLRKCLKPSLTNFSEQHFLKLSGVPFCLVADPKQHSHCGDPDSGTHIPVFVWRIKLGTLFKESKLFGHGVSLILQAILTSGGGMLFGIFDGHGGAACGQASP
jgi:hypothetical protein